MCVGGEGLNSRDSGAEQSVREEGRNGAHG